MQSLKPCRSRSCRYLREEISTWRNGQCKASEVGHNWCVWEKHGEECDQSRVRKGRVIWEEVREIKGSQEARLHRAPQGTSRTLVFAWEKQWAIAGVWIDRHDPDYVFEGSIWTTSLWGVKMIHGSHSTSLNLKTAMWTYKIWSKPK